MMNILKITKEHKFTESCEKSGTCAKQCIPDHSFRLHLITFMGRAWEPSQYEGLEDW